MNAGNVIFNFKGDDSDLTKKTNNVSSKLKNVASGIAKAFTVGVGAATTAMTVLVKKSVEAVGEFEQLAGGAQKIFDEMDYSQIEEDAVNAYKTMNMSANEYLSAINNVGATFSSTMGDTKGYETAKKGLQAISDYATGTGKDIDTLSEKYQMITRSTSSYLSIADQFSGLLPQTTDGFLEAAQAAGYLSDEYTSLTDVPVAEYQQALTELLEDGVDALNLTGNTAAEASDTLTGSISAAKSAFENFISGASDIDQVVETFGNAAENIVKVVAEMTPSLLNGMVTLINNLLPQVPILIQQLLPGVVSGVVSIITGIINLLPQIIEMLASMLPTILESLINGLMTIGQSLIQMLPTIIPQIITAIIEALAMINEHFDEFMMMGFQIIWAIIQGLINSIPTIIANLPTIIEAMLNFFTAGKMLSAGTALLKGLGNGLIKSIPSLISNLPQIITSMVSTLKTQGVAGFKDIGVQLLKGLWNGLSSAKDWIVNKIKGLGSSVMSAIKGIFGIHSPSTEFAWIGQMNMEGLIQGTEDMEGQVEDVYSDLGTLAGVDSMFDLSPSLYGTASNNLSPSVNVTVNNNMTTDPLGQVVNTIKTYSGGAKNDYNYGTGV